MGNSWLTECTPWYLLVIPIRFQICFFEGRRYEKVKSRGTVQQCRIRFENLELKYRLTKLVYKFEEVFPRIGYKAVNYWKEVKIKE